MDNNIQEGNFKKSIGVFGGISIVAGIMIGSGIYFVGSFVLERTNFSAGWSIIAWIVGGLVTIAAGLCFAELGASMPVAGGQTVYLSEAYAPVFGFLNGFSTFILTGCGGVAALSLVAVKAYERVFRANTDFEMGDVTVKILAIIIILALMGLNLLGAKEMMIYQNFSMVIRVIPVLMVIFVGLSTGNQPLDLSLSTVGTSAEDGGITGFISLVGFATFASLWAYDGWYNLNTVAEEMKNPRRDLPLSIIISIGGVTVLYVLFNLAVFKVLPHGDILSMLDVDEDFQDLYLGSEVVFRTLGHPGLIILLVCMTIGIIGTANGSVLCDPRMYYAMAKENYFPKIFMHLDKKRGVPTYGILFECGLAIIFVLFNSLEDLVDLLLFAISILNLLTIYAVLRLRKKYPDMERPYKVWGGRVTVYITSVVYIILMINEFMDAPRAGIIGLAVMAAGLLVYLYFWKKNKGQGYKGEGLE